MNHLEAQSYIMPFIEGNLPENKQEDFVIHMKNCKKCHEELEIYYTLLVGMKQLDNKQSLSTDFNRDLEQELKSMSHKAKGRKRFRVSAFSAIMAVILVLGTLAYADVISKVYNFEQSTKAGNQGEYYFYNSLGEDFVFDNVDRIYTGVKIDDEKKISDFQRIRGFQDMENAYDQIMTMGEEMTYVEITTD